MCCLKALLEGCESCPEPHDEAPRWQRLPKRNPIGIRKQTFSCGRTWERNRSSRRRSRLRRTATIRRSRPRWTGTARTLPETPGEWLLALIERGRRAAAPARIRQAAGAEAGRRSGGGDRPRLARRGGPTEAARQTVPQLGRQGGAAVVRRADAAAVRPRAAFDQGASSRRSRATEAATRAAGHVRAVRRSRSTRSPTRCCGPTSIATSGSTG